MSKTAGGSQGEVHHVVLMLNHPNEKLNVITEALGLQPDYKWQAGQPRSTPIGTPLPGGTASSPTPARAATRMKRSADFARVMAP